MTNTIIKLVLHTLPNISMLHNQFYDCVTAANKSTDGKKFNQGTGILLKMMSGSVIFTQSVYVNFYTCCKT